MSKKWLSVLSVSCLMVCLGIVLVSGCQQASSGSGSTLPSGTEAGEAITSPEATLTGAIGIASGGEVDINLGGVIPTGTTEAVAVELGRTEVYVASGDLSSAAGVRASSVWTRVDISFYETDESPMDIVHILDNTGSMGGQITSVKDSIVAWALSIEAAGFDAQHALVTYGDSAIHPTPAGYITSESFTDASYERPILDLSTAATLQSTLAAVNADLGGDGPENPLDSVKWALNTETRASVAADNITYRSGAQKILIIYTDINGHQSVEADVSSNNKCTTTMTDEVTRVRSNNAKVYAVSPNYTYSQWPYCDVRQLADGLGEGRTTSSSSTTGGSGGAWIQMPYSGDVDLTALGITGSLTAGRTLRITGFTFATGATYTIIVYYDVDGDGTLDSYAYFVFVYSSSSSADAKVLTADDGIARPNN